MPFEEESPFWEPDALHFSANGSRELGRRLARAIRPYFSEGKTQKGLGTLTPSFVRAADDWDEWEAVD